VSLDIAKAIEQFEPQDIIYLLKETQENNTLFFFRKLTLSEKTEDIKNINVLYCPSMSEEHEATKVKLYLKNVDLDSNLEIKNIHNLFSLIYLSLQGKTLFCSDGFYDSLEKSLKNS